MTNEEAIKRLSKIKAIYKGMDNKSDVKALDMAIKALSEPTNVADDYDLEVDEDDDYDHDFDGGEEDGW